MVKKTFQRHRRIPNKLFSFLYLRRLHFGGLHRQLWPASPPRKPRSRSSRRGSFDGRLPPSAAAHAPAAQPRQRAGAPAAAPAARGERAPAVAAAGPAAGLPGPAAAEPVGAAAAPAGAGAGDEAGGTAQGDGAQVRREENIFISVVVASPHFPYTNAHVY